MGEGGKAFRAFADRVAGMIPKLISAFVLIFMFAPLVILIVQSFNISPIIFPPQVFSLRLYASLFSRQDFKESLVTSAILATCTSALSLVVGLPAAFFLARHEFKGKSLLNTLLFTPVMVPGVVTGVALLIFFASFRIITFAELLIGHFLLTLPYVTRMSSAGLLNFDRSLEEAALNLGANEFQTAIRITLPSIRATLLAAVIFVFQMSFNDVSVAIFLSSATVYTLPVVLLSWSQFFFDPVIVAASGFIILMTTIIILIVEKILGIDKLVGTTIGQI